MENLKQASREIYSQVRPPNFLGQSFALQLQFTIYIFFRKAVMRKLFDIRFSYKHYNFSRICLLFKIASKTVTRSILPHTAYIMCLCFFAECYTTKSLQQPRVGLLCAFECSAFQGNLTINSGRLCPPTPLPPPEDHVVIHSQQSAFNFQSV